MQPIVDFDDDLFTFPTALTSRAMEPFRSSASLMNQLSNNVETKDSFLFRVPVEEYPADDVVVKVEKSANGRDNILHVSGKHTVNDEEKGFYSTSNFSRQFTLGSNADIENITASISKKGLLEVTVPKKEKEEEKKSVQVIPIKTKNDKVEK